MRRPITLAILSLAVIPLAGGLFRTDINPPRLYPSDALMILPILLCICVGVMIHDPIRRILYAIMQALLLILAYDNFLDRTLRLGTDDEVLALIIRCVLFTIGYAFTFFVVTHILRRILSLPAPRLGQCQECGYDLQGLSKPRCPECGRSFTPIDQ